jgi:trehalose synthase
LYKGTPVVASDVGGIPLQVIDAVTGFLHDPYDIQGFCDSIVKLLKDKKLRDELGKNGEEHVKKNFLITRLITDWIDLFTQYLA